MNSGHVLRSKLNIFTRLSDHGQEIVVVDTSAGPTATLPVACVVSTPADQSLERRELDALNQTLEPALSDLGGRFVGRTTVEGKRQWLFHLPESAALSADAAVQQAISSTLPGVKVAVETHADPQWQQFKQQFSPPSVRIEYNVAAPPAPRVQEEDKPVIEPRAPAAMPVPKASAPPPIPSGQSAATAESLSKPAMPVTTLSSSAKTSALAVVSLVMSILCSPVMIIGSLIAAILGHVSLGKIRRSQGRLQGRGIALAAILLGWFGVIGWVAFGISLAPFVIKLSKEKDPMVIRQMVEEEIMRRQGVSNPTPAPPVNPPVQQ